MSESFNPRSLRKSLARPRSLLSYTLSAVTTLLTLTALVPLFAIVYMLLSNGLRAWDWSMFTARPPTLTGEAGGFGPALAGTALMCLIASLIAVPLGVLGAVFTAEVAPESRLAAAVRFAGKTLTGFPSILAGVFAYTVVVVYFGRPSALAGGFALSILMVPVVLIAADGAIRAVPKPMKDAAFGMGATRTQVILGVALPTAFPGVFTGVMLALARAIGETAPLLYTAQFSYYYLTEGGLDLTTRPTASLSVLIYNFQEQRSDARVEILWVAALVLVLVVLTLNLIGQAFARRR